VDAGPGTSINFERAGARFEDLDLMLFTHLHVDHTGALPAFVKGSYFTQRIAPLSVLGPRGNHLLPETAEFIDRLFSDGGVYPYLADLVSPAAASNGYTLTGRTISPPAGETQSIVVNEQLTVTAVQSHHGPLMALAWRVDIDGVAIIFSGDTTNRGNSLQTLKTDQLALLVAHNAVPEGATGAAANLHMPPSVIAKAASDLDSPHLLLSHLMTRSAAALEESLTTISEIYGGELSVAEDMACVIVK
jgi:ribonuclease BN (tRNA processing enzyme)